MVEEEKREQKVLEASVSVCQNITPLQNHFNKCIGLVKTEYQFSHFSLLSGNKYYQYLGFFVVTQGIFTPDTYSVSQ